MSDVFDALISNRVYKNAMSYDEVKKIIANGRGQHFDPDMVDTFLAKFNVYCDIADRHREQIG